ncbi:hypothetical protein Naga_101888g1 [Nannochloropsis gaditana]|uniref:Uncharacterized protein n=1 Tax=Nannochloropsis gaditana TaxID=72520 RepID=W7T024_9STRA|nr:hypothetical protein Naga_101888g1 [Nannochloropsis gaditana]
MVLASVAGIAVVGVLCVCLPCMIIINIIKQACSCPPSPFGLALWQARGTRFATNLWSSMRRGRKGRVLRGGFSSTAHTGPGTSSGEELGKKWATFFQGIGAVLGVAGATAVVVRTFDQTEMATEIKYVQSKAAAEIAQAKAEIARVEDKAAAEIAQAKAEIAQAKAEIARVEDKAAAEIARVEDKRTMSEVFWKAEVERFKREVQLAYTQDYEPYQAALMDKRKKRGGTGGLEEKEEEN